MLSIPLENGRFTARPRRLAQCVLVAKCRKRTVLGRNVESEMRITFAVPDLCVFTGRYGIQLALVLRETDVVSARRRLSIN